MQYRWARLQYYMSVWRKPFVNFYHSMSACDIHLYSDASQQRPQESKKQSLNTMCPFGALFEDN